MTITSLPRNPSLRTLLHAGNSLPTTAAEAADGCYHTGTGRDGSSACTTHLGRLHAWVTPFFLFSPRQEGKREGVNCCKENSYDIQHHKQAEAVLTEAQVEERTSPKPAAPCRN